MSGEMTAPSSTTGAGGPPMEPATPSGAAAGGSGGSSGGEKVGATVQQTGQEARHLVDEGKEQLRSLSGDARTAMRERVDERTSTIAASLAGIADDLDTMAGATEHEGPLPTAAHQLAGVARNTSRRLEEGGAEGVVDDVRDYARKHPGVFLGVAFGLGIVAGRLLRGDIDERRDGEGSSPREIDLRDVPTRQATARSAAPGAPTDGPDPRDVGLTTASAPVGGGLASPGGELP